MCLFNLFIQWHIESKWKQTPTGYWHDHFPSFLVFLFLAGASLFLWLGCLLISLYFDCSARTSSTLWNRSGESGHLCFVSVYKGKAFNLSSLSMMLALTYMASIMLCSIYTNLLRVFIIKGCCTVKCFFCIYWDGPMIFIFHPVKVM